METGSRAPEYRDVEAIAHGQIALEDSMAAKASQLLIHDTDLLSTIVYSQHYFGDCPLWIEAALLDRQADLYLLAGIDVPWVPDGDHRDRGDRREEMQELFTRALEEFQLPWIEISGSREHRLERATRHLEELQGRSATSTARDSRDPIRPDER